MLRSLKVTLKDIARHAGTNIASVSNTLCSTTSSPNVSEETQKRIRAAAKELGYHKNAIAASIRTGFNPSVALIIDSKWNDPASSSGNLIAGIVSEVAKRHYCLSVFSDADPEAAIDAILCYQIVKVLVMSIDQELRLKIALLCKKYKLELVFIYEKGECGFPAVNSDNYTGVKNTIRELIRLGHRNIAFCCGDHVLHYITEKHRAYVDALQEAGIEIRRKLLICKFGFDHTRLARRLMALPPEIRPTVLFASDGDDTALLMMNAFLHLNFRVPEDISIVGYGNFEKTQNSSIPLSTVKEDISRIGTTALGLLFGETSGISPDEHGDYLISTEFILRDSVCSPIFLKKSSDNKQKEVKQQGKKK